MSERDEDWLLARERGEDVSHIPAETREKYERLQRMIAALPDVPPKPGWEDRVREAIEKEERAKAAGGAPTAPIANPPDADLPTDAPPVTEPSPEQEKELVPVPPHVAGANGAQAEKNGTAEPKSGSSNESKNDPGALIGETTTTASTAPNNNGGEVVSIERRKKAPKSPWLYTLGIAFAAAAAIILWLAIKPSGQPNKRPRESDKEIAFERTIRKNPNPSRSVHSEDAANIGDTLVFDASSSQQIEIRVYNEMGEMVKRCKMEPSPGCTYQRGVRNVLHLEWEAKARGTIQAFIIAGNKIPEPTNEREHDLLQLSKVRPTPVHRDISTLVY